ncbi:MAG: hypothetical protein HWD59_00305 [Coxiellaceae bacterium]|nr:MAG: hypothetical protein HWD59_00305 [Coxiellaceae bacterium]
MYIDCVANTVPKLAPLLKTLLHNKITLQLYGMAQVASVSDATPECEWHWDQKQLVCKTTLHINTIDVGRNPYEIDKSGNLTLKDSFINAAVTAKKQRYVFDATTTIVFSSQQESLTANIHDIKIDFFSNRLNCKSNVTMVEEQQPSQARPGF